MPAHICTHHKAFLRTVEWDNKVAWPLILRLDSAKDRFYKAARIGDGRKKSLYASSTAQKSDGYSTK